MHWRLSAHCINVHPTKTRNDPYEGTNLTSNIARTNSEAQHTLRQSKKLYCQDNSGFSLLPTIFQAMYYTSHSNTFKLRFWSSQRCHRFSASLGPCIPPHETTPMFKCSIGCWKSAPVPLPAQPRLHLLFPLVLYIFRSHHHPIPSRIMAQVKPTHLSTFLDSLGAQLGIYWAFGRWLAWILGVGHGEYSWWSTMASNLRRASD